MKLCTYNIWNHDKNFDKRIEKLIEEINNEDIDILAMQEVRSQNIVKRLVNACDFSHFYWKKYHDCQEGLAILSKYEIVDTWTNWDASTDVHNSGSMIVSIKYNDMILGVCNVHLDHKNALNREIEIVKAVQATENFQTDYNFILGDFNCTPKASVYAYLTGQWSMLNHGTKWIDLGQSYASLKGQPPGVTIDYYNNPRWDKKVVLDIPARFDWIFIESPYPKPHPELKSYKVIGKQGAENITPSDHYGVTRVLDFEPVISENRSLYKGRE
ncbi:endonuclease/exonuclease/phosphatase family protein [Fusibacter sp. JL216-2]|uniref:endonuclease/exonuclease/phosphatase family protein n=1 Tax=Fusibacter sp. JL216-2 TaxID=3071453 RepID=UPI003D3333E1